MENRYVIDLLHRAPLLVLILGGGAAAHADAVLTAATYDGSVFSYAAGVPGCSVLLPNSAYLCAETPNRLLQGGVPFNQQWDTGNGSAFIDGEASTRGDNQTITATARMRTDFGGYAETTISYQLMLVPIVPINYTGSTVPVHAGGFGSVQIVPDAAASDFSELAGEASLDIRGVSGRGTPATLPALVFTRSDCFRGNCTSDGRPTSFALDYTFDMGIVPSSNSVTTVTMFATADVVPRFPGRAAGEVIATVDPRFYIDPDFMINGVPATDLFRLDFSPNLPAVPLPATALLFPTALAALGWSRRKRLTKTGT